MKIPELCLAALLLLSPIVAQRYLSADGKIRVGLVKMPYTGARNVAELSKNPDYLEAGGLPDLLRKNNVQWKPTVTVKLSLAQEKDYGEWHRMGLANGRLSALVADNEKRGFLTIGLLGNCTSVIGVAAGLQRSGPSRRPRKVGLVFIDAHGDFNTPETTLSGMLGGMPVAVCAGKCLMRLRMKSRLDPALPTSYIVMVCVRDTDPLEEELIENSGIQRLDLHDVRERSDNLRNQMRRLSKLTDLIYVHVDMDVLDPKEVPGHPLTVPNGPTSKELAGALEVMFRFEKVAALGIASTPAGDKDPGGVSRKAAYNLVEGALAGVRARPVSKKREGK